MESEDEEYAAVIVHPHLQEDDGMTTVTQTQPPFHHVLPELDPFEKEEASPNVALAVLPKEQSLSFKKRFNLFLDHHFHLTTSNPEIVLPYPPTEEEKGSYLATKRALVVAIGAFSFCATVSSLLESVATGRVTHSMPRSSP